MIDVYDVCNECKPDIGHWMGQLVCSCCRDALEDCMNDDEFNDEAQEQGHD